VFVLSPANALPLLLLQELKAYNISESPWGPGLFSDDNPAVVIHPIAEKVRITKFGAKMAIIAILTSKASIFSPGTQEIFPTIRPAITQSE
jgi:hypothetical protein